MGLKKYGFSVLFAIGALQATESYDFAASTCAANLASHTSQMEPVAKREQSCTRLDHRAQIGANYTYAWISPDENSTTSGSLGGAQALYEYYPSDSLYGGLAFNWRMGTTHHKSGSRSVKDYNIQERLGYTFCLKQLRTKATLFSGFGARHLAETVSSGDASVDFKYTEFYVPVGVLFETSITSNFLWGLNFQWMPQVFPTVEMKPLGGANWKLLHRVDNFFVEMPLKLRSCSGRFLLVVSPFFEAWHDGRSKVSTTNGLNGPGAVSLGIPGNTYLFTGLNVNAGFSF